MNKKDITIYTSKDRDVLRLEQVDKCRGYIALVQVGYRNMDSMMVDKWQGVFLSRKNLIKVRNMINKILNVSETQ